MSMKGRILLADDEELFLRTVADVLNKEGYECAQSYSAESALEMLKTS